MVLIKYLVINKAKKTFNDDTITKLNDILAPQHLGVYEKDIIDERDREFERL